MVWSMVQASPRSESVSALGRRLTPAQVSRRDRLVDVAYALAREGGYAAVTIDAVRERADVARATIYHHFGSKDHLIAAAIVRWGGEIQSRMRAAPPEKGDLLERVIETLRAVVETAEAEPELLQAAMQAVVSRDLGVDEMQRQLSGVVSGYLETVVDPEGELDTDLLGMVLGHVLFSSLIQMAAGRRRSAEVMQDLATTAELILRRR